MTENANIDKPTSVPSLSSSDVDFPDVFSDSKPTRRGSSSRGEKQQQQQKPPHSENDTAERLVKESGAFAGRKKEQPNKVSSESATTNMVETTNDEQNGQPLGSNPTTLSNPICSSLREQVRPGQSKRTHFPLIPSKVALLVIDIQEYLSTPSSVQHEQEDAYFYQTSLPRTLSNVQELLKHVRQQRDSQSQGCEIIFTYLQALTQDCRDVSLDYKLSGPQLATLPNAPSSPAKFLDSVAPLTTDGKGDILIPKTSCSVFLSTNLHYVLQNLHAEQILVCGQLTDQCVESAVRDAADLGYFVTVVHDACAAKSHDAHLKGLSGMKGFSRALCTEQVLTELRNPQTASLVVARNIVAEPVEEETAADDNDEEPAPPQPTETGESSSHDVSIIATEEWHTPPCNQDATTRALLHALQFAGVKFLRYMAVDACNSIRSKAVPLHHLTKTNQFNHQVAIAQVCFAGLPTFGDYMVEQTGLDARHVLTLQPDIGSLRILPYAPSAAVVMGNAWDPVTNCISPLCTRGLLSRVVETARQGGIEFNVGAEIEFCLYKDGHPVDQSVFGNVTTMNDQQAFLMDLDEQLQQQQIQVQQIHSESAPGQVELVLEYQDDPVRLADWVVLTRETIASVAKNRHGLDAIFLPKLHADKAGNGCHLHLSFRETNTTTSVNDKSKRQNAFPHATLAGELSVKAKSFMEGILRHLSSLLALTLPTVNSFRRVGPGCWTGSTVGWDMEDKETALRVCMDTATRQWTNVEYKLCDSTANLYLALSGLLACGWNGIQQNLTLRPSLRQAEEMGEVTLRPSLSSTPLPSNLQESLTCLAGDDFLCTHVLGPELSKAYIVVRRAEAEMFATTTLDEEVALALSKS